MMDIRFTLDMWVYMFQISSYTGNRKDFLMGHVIFTVILFCFTFVSYLIAIRFMIALFYIGHSLLVGPIGVEMYRVTILG